MKDRRTQFEIVYEGTNVHVTNHVLKLVSTLEQNDVKIDTRQLRDWDANDVNRKPNVIFFADAEKEHFHTRVRTDFVSMYQTSYIVLVYPLKFEDQAMKSLKFIKKNIKAKYKINKDLGRQEAEKALGKIVTVSDVNNISSWLPRLLKIVCEQAPKTKQRELALFYYIDVNSEPQLKWYSEQRQVLEEVFGLACRCSEDFIKTNDDVLRRYVQRSTCVVQYVKPDIDFVDSLNQESVKRAHDRVRVEIDRVASVCRETGSGLLVYTEDADAGLADVLEERCSMDVIGTDGLVSLWLGILSVLGRVHSVKQPDVMFHSEVTSEISYTRFNPSRYPETFPDASRPQTTREGVSRHVRPMSVMANVPDQVVGVTLQSSACPVERQAAPLLPSGGVCSWCLPFRCLPQSLRGRSDALV